MLVKSFRVPREYVPHERDYIQWRGKRFNNMVNTNFPIAQSGINVNLSSLDYILIKQCVEKVELKTNPMVLKKVYQHLLGKLPIIHNYDRYVIQNDKYIILIIFSKIYKLHVGINLENFI